MGMVLLDDLRPGMLVGLDVLDSAGQVLLRQGMQLTERHLRVLRAWGVSQVDIEGAGAGLQEAAVVATQEQQEEIQRRINRLFLKANLDHPVIKELQRLGEMRMLRQLVRGESV
jgi:hypothetical protein